MARVKAKGRLMRQADAARLLGIARASMHYHIGAGHLDTRDVAGVRFVTRASVERLARTPRQAALRNGA